MSRTYSGHIDDKNKLDLGLHKKACSVIERLYTNNGNSLTNNDEESIKKDCFQYIDSEGKKIQVISATVTDHENGPALVIENHGIQYKNKNRKMRHYPGRIRGSKADVIFFVLYMNEGKVRVVKTHPNKIIDYLNRFCNAQKSTGKRPERDSKIARKLALEQWNLAYKIDSNGTVRMIAPITVAELSTLINNTSVFDKNLGSQDVDNKASMKGSSMECVADSSSLQVLEGKQTADWVEANILSNIPKFDETRSYKQNGVDQGFYYIDDRCGIRSISPQDAAEIFEIHNVKNRKHQVSYSTDLGSRMCHAVDIAFVVIAETGEVFVVNGQHTLSGIVSKNETVDASVRVYYARDIAAYNNIFQLTDDNKRRTVDQNIRMAVQNGIMIGRNPSLTKTALSAYILAENNFKNNQSPKTIQGKLSYAESQDFQDFIEQLSEFTSIFVHKDKRKLVPVGVVASFRAMLKYNKTKGLEFIRMYIAGSNLSDNDPILALRNRILVSPSGGVENMQAHIGLCYSAWKCFIENRDCDLLRQTTKVPEVDKWNPIYITSKKSRN